MEQPLDILRPGISFPALKTLLPDMLPEDGQFGGLHSEELSDPFVYDLIERMWASCESGDPYGQFFAEGALTTLAATLLRLSSPPVTKQVARAGLAPWQVRRVTAALLDLLAEDTSLTVLAADMGLSPIHFARAVKQSLDLSPF